MNDRNTRRMMLKDVRILLPQIYSGDTLRLYDDAFSRLEKVLSQKLSNIPADEKAWSEIADKIVWAGEFRGATPTASERAFKACVGKVTTAIRKTKKLVEGDPPADSGADAAWDLILAYVMEVENTFDADGELILPNMASLSIANLRSRLGHVHPAQVNLACATEGFYALPADKVATYRNSLRFFDSLILGPNHHAPLTGLLPAVPVGVLPTLRDAALDWSRFSPEFIASVEAAMTTAIRGQRTGHDRFGGRLGEDRLADRRAARKLRKKRVGNPEVSRKNYRSALSWLIRHGFQPRELAYEAQSFGEILAPEVIHRATTAYVERSRSDRALLDAKATSSVGTYLATLMTLARANGCDKAVVIAIEDAQYDNDIGDPNTAEMSATRAAFIKLVDRDPAKVHAIVTGPQVLAAEATKGFACWERLGKHARSRVLHLCMTACMLALQLARPLRTLNVNKMTIGGVAPELLAPVRDGAESWLDIPKSRTKNKNPIENPLPAWAWEVMTLWIDVGRPLWIAHHANDDNEEDANPPATSQQLEEDSIYLFPGIRRHEEVSRGVINKAWNKGMELLGLRGLTPHVMRHVCATLYLARWPGDYRTVAALLGDRLSTVEAFYIRGEGRQAAQLFAEVIQELNPALNVNGPIKKSHSRVA